MIKKPSLKLCERNLYLVALLAMLCVSAISCSLKTKTITPENISLLKPGVTTLTEMNQVFGEPVHISFDSEGKKIVDWDRNVFYPGILHDTVETTTLSAVFDGNDVMQNYVTGQGDRKIAFFMEID